jgi:hypothetical protein
MSQVTIGRSYVKSQNSQGSKLKRGQSFSNPTMNHGSSDTLTVHDTYLFSRRDDWKLEFIRIRQGGDW